MAAMAMAGRDKVTLLTSPALNSFGLWVEQLLAESTGKEGTGIVPVAGEPLASPTAYGADRLFVTLRLKGDRNAALDRSIITLQRAGHPVFRLNLADRYDLGGEFFRWEFATAVAGHALGIVQVHESPAVGKHLHDHIDAILGYHIPLDPNLLGVSPVGGVNLWKAWRRWQRERRGMLCTNFAEVTGFHSLHADSPKPEIQYEFVIALAMDHGRDIYWKHGMSCHVLILHPKSRGSVTLASPRWQDDPVIDFRYFSHPQDLDDLAEGARRVHEVFWNTSLRQHIKTDLLTAKCKTQDDWKEFCRNASGTGYHPVGSCRMGPDPADNVVDARLRVGIFGG